MSALESAPPPGPRGPEAYDAWRAEALIPKMFEVETDPRDFYSNFVRRAFGSSLLVEYDTAATGFARGPARARRDGIDAIWVQMVAHGGLKARAPGVEVALAPGSAGVCDLGKPVEQVSLAGTGRVFMLPREAFGRPLDDAHGWRLDGARFRLLDEYFSWLVQAPPRPDRAAQTAEAIAQVVLACFTHPEPPSPAARAALGQAALRRAEACIAERLADPKLNADAVAAAAGVSRATLYRLAKPFGGVDAMIWRRRLEAARAALSDPRRRGRIGEIGEAFGFTSHAHFSLRFRARYGFSPRNLRPF